MNTSFINRVKIEEFMQHNLKPKRIKHSKAVEEMASKLAHIYGADPDKAAFAGRYHDIAKCFSEELLNRYVREYGLDESCFNNRSLAHSKVGAAILKNEFGINDSEILAAIESHTTGRANMSLLEEICFISDAIDETREYDGVLELRERVKTDLDGVCLFIIKYSIDDVKSKNKKLHPDTIDALHYMENKLKGRINE